MSGDPRADAGGPLARAGEAWRGDEHRLQVAAAAEAGLEARDVAVELYRQGFARGLVVEDPLDRAIVVRGRTVLRAEQLTAALRGALGHLHLPPGSFAVKAQDGDFEVRVAARAVEHGGTTMAATRQALLAFVLGGLVGLLFLKSQGALALIAFSFGLLGGSFILRRGLRQGRALLAARVVDEIARLAAAEQLILPPASARDG